MTYNDYTRTDQKLTIDGITCYLYIKDSDYDAFLCGEDRDLFVKVKSNDGTVLFSKVSVANDDE